MRTTLLMLAATAACFASACAGVPHRLEPATVAAARGTNVSSLIPQQRITVKWVPSGYADGSLLGAIIASSANKGRRNKAEETAVPLQWQTQDIDFQSRYTEALNALVKDVAYLRFESLRRYDAQLPPVSTADVQAGNLLRVGTDYYLSPDSNTLVVSSGLGFFAAGQPDRAAAVMRTFYRSEEIGRVEDERAVALWAADGGRRYRRALAEGAAENLKMTRMALAYIGGTDYAGPKVRLHALLDHGRGDFGIKQSATVLEGTIVEESAGRVILSTGDGFFSIPRSAIDARDDLGRSPGIAWQPPQISTALVFAAPSPPTPPAVIPAPAPAPPAPQAPTPAAYSPPVPTAPPAAPTKP